MDTKTLTAFLVWIKDNGYHRYHDGTYYNNKKIRDAKYPTKFWKPEELAGLFIEQYNF